MKYIFLYIFIYCNADAILNKLYLSNYTNDTISDGFQSIQSNSNFYYASSNIHIFTLLVYSLYIVKEVFHYSCVNIYSIVLALIYIKYSLNILLDDTISLNQYEFSRNIMWLFATPLMLNIYSDVNGVKIKSIHIEYHLIPTIINIFIYPHKNTNIYYYFTGISWVSLFLFIKNLYKKQNLLFTNIFLFIWAIFMCINLLDTFQLADRYKINLYYCFADMISKMMTGIIINDYNKRELCQMNNMDLQSVQFVSYMITQINKFKTDNMNITKQCNQFIEFSRKCFLDKIPENKVSLEQELLKKILPFDFDKEYISAATATETASSNVTSSDVAATAKQINMICVLFTDIVNYTELSKKYDDRVIFQLLYTIYTKFDNKISSFTKNRDNRRCLHGNR